MAVLEKYFDEWHEHFYLFSDEYPFMQVRKSYFAPDKIYNPNSKANPPTIITGKTINRTISQSGSRIAIFSPKTEAKKNKEILTPAEIARWLITYHGYVGLLDKASFRHRSYLTSNSKGWLFDIGGLYLKGQNLFETLMLSLVLAREEEDYLAAVEKPVWEWQVSELLDFYFSNEPLTSIALLYTTWGRATYIDPKYQFGEAFELRVVKIPELDHQNHFLEPMTLWRFNDSGNNKGTFTPRKHRPEESLWREFGLIADVHVSGASDKKRMPGIMSWLEVLEENLADLDQHIGVAAVSMEDDGNATSWLPVGEITDQLAMKEKVLTDVSDEGWLVRIANVIQDTKQAVQNIYGAYMSDISYLRNFHGNVFRKDQVEAVFAEIDYPFKQWLAAIEADDPKDETVRTWQQHLLALLLERGKTFLASASVKEYKIKTMKRRGKQEYPLNIALAYDRFAARLRQKLTGGGKR